MEFSWKRIGKVVGVIVLVGAAAAGIYFFVSWNPVKIAWTDWFHDRRENFIGCEHLPFYPQVQKAAGQHQDLIAQVKAIPGVGGFGPNEQPCTNYPGGILFLKGQMVLTYQNRAARQKAENIIGRTFFGIPYRGEEVK